MYYNFGIVSLMFLSSESLKVLLKESQIVY